MSSGRRLRLLGMAAVTVTVGLGVAFLVMEVLFRVFLPQPVGLSYRSEMSLPIYTPNHTLHRNEPEFEITTTFNSLGLRGQGILG